MNYRISMLVLLLLGVVGLMPVQAATFTANDAASLISAINTANGNSEDDIITLTADIALDGTTTYPTAGTNGLPSITSSSNITINGADFSIARSTVEGTPNFRVFHVANGATLILNNVTVSNGSAIAESSPADSGGGIYNSGTVTVNNSTISGNSADNDGGGIYNSGTVTVNNSTVSDNSSRFGGGIRNHGTVTVNNSTLSGNSVTQNGGGIDNDGTTTISNSTFSGNSADSDGGGILNSLNRILTINNSTLSGNSAGNNGGGIENFSSGTATVNNTIIAYNTAINGANCSGTISGSSNLANGGGCTSFDSIIPGTDYNTTLANNGGPTETHALLMGSPAIDNSNMSATLADQRGALAVGARDIGAYEYLGIAPTPAVAIPLLGHFGLGLLILLLAASAALVGSRSRKIA